MSNAHLTTETMSMPAVTPEGAYSGAEYIRGVHDELETLCSELVNIDNQVGEQREIGSQMLDILKEMVAEVTTLSFLPNPRIPIAEAIENYILPAAVETMQRAGVAARKVGGDTIYELTTPETLEGRVPLATVREAIEKENKSRNEASARDDAGLYYDLTVLSGMLQMAERSIGDKPEMLRQFMNVAALAHRLVSRELSPQRADAALNQEMQSGREWER